MKLMTLLLLIFLSVSCQRSEGDDSGSINNQNILNAPDDLATEPGVPAVANDFDSNINFLNFSMDQQTKMEKAIEIIKLVVATEEFKERILNFTYSGQKSFFDNGGYTNGQIYQKILEGAESLRPIIDYTMNGEVELYFEDSRTIGYTYPTTTRIWVNTKYFNNYTPAGVAHNLFHEWMHKLGFNHAATWSISRDSSVPYAVGYILGDIGKDFL